MAISEGAARTEGWRTWRFFTTHAQVLLALSREPEARVSELAESVELTERATYRILADLQKAGYVTRERVGRRNRYVVNVGLLVAETGVEAALLTDLFKLVADDDT